MESARLIADLTVFFVQTVRRILEAVGKLDQEYDAASLEEFVRGELRALGAVVFEGALALRGREEPREALRACACGGRQVRQGRAERTIRTTLGPVTLTERFRYRCRKCGAVSFSGDELRGAGDFSELAERLISYTGQAVGGMFAQAQATLRRLLGLEVTARTVEAVSLRRGRRVIAAEGRAVAASHRVEAEERAERLVIGVDGVLIGRVDQQHRRRSSAKKGPVPEKGRLTNFWKEVKVCVVYGIDAAGKAAGRKTYCATQGSPEAFAERVVVEAARRGAAWARELVFLGDGARWIWNLCAREFPRAIQVLDWYHAVEHLWEAGRAQFGETSERLAGWVKEQEGRLYAGRVARVIETLKALAAATGEAPPGAPETDPRVVLRRNAGYFEENALRMNYPEYRARGIPIGSGLVESACKHVVASRLRGPGMRWDEEGAETILHLRCLAESDRWDEFWERDRAVQEREGARAAA
jgi:hypothetical protein